MTRVYSEIEVESVDWLWKDRIALGKLSLIAGVPGVGKTFLLTDLMARCSLGASFPDGATATRCESLIMTSEDGAGDTIAPRLQAHGADMSKVHHMDFVDEGGKEQFFTITGHLSALDCWLADHPACKLIVMDPITAFLGDGIDSHKNAEVRQALGPLSQLAERRDVAVVGNTHLSKAQAKAINRVIGSIAFIAAARSCWLVDWCPENDGRRLFVPIKNNLAHTDGLAYTIADGRLVWEADAITVTADDLSGDGATSLDDAKEFLRQALSDGKMPSKAVVKDAKNEGISERTLNRAKKQLHIESNKYGNQWCWEMPTQFDSFADWNEGKIAND